MPQGGTYSCSPPREMEGRYLPGTWQAPRPPKSTTDQLALVGKNSSLKVPLGPALPSVNRPSADKLRGTTSTSPGTPHRQSQDAFAHAFVWLEQLLLRTASCFLHHHPGRENLRRTCQRRHFPSLYDPRRFRAFTRQMTHAVESTVHIPTAHRWHRIMPAKRAGRTWAGASPLVLL